MNIHNELNSGFKVANGGIFLYSKGWTKGCGEMKEASKGRN